MGLGRGTRSAAVLMAGLLGAAVIAPGVAFAEGTATVPVTCSSTEKPNADQTECVPDPAASTSTTTTTTSTTPAGKPTADVPSVGTSSPSAGQLPDATAVTPTEKAVAPETVPPKAAAVPAVAPPTISAAQVTTSLQNLSGVDLTSGLPITDALQQLPTGNLDLGDVTIPELPSSGSFSSPRDACLFLASKVTVPGSQAAAIGQQFASFCAALPGSFDPSSGYGSVPDLVAALDELCDHLKDTHHHHDDARDDIDCGDVSYDEAQAILASDRSDPNNLDGDDDGIACEDNPRGYRSVSDDYDGYPQGGVATGDSMPGVAPAGTAGLAGLGLASLAGATRRREEDEDEVRA